jgi:hypothetical protein
MSPLDSLVTSLVTLSLFRIPAAIYAAVVRFRHGLSWHNVRRRLGLVAGRRHHYIVAAAAMASSSALVLLLFRARRLPPTSRSSRPTEEIKAILAGIYDRFSTMMAAMRTESLTFTTASGDSEWEPGPGTRVSMSPSLWRRPLRARVRLLFRRLATATPDIRQGLVGGYTNVTDRFRQIQGNGP